MQKKHYLFLLLGLLGIFILLPVHPPVYGRTVDVTTFGANGQDTKNDKTYIQNALNIVPEEGDSLIVEIPDGTYYINGPLYIHSNTTIRMSKNACIKRNSSGMKHNMLKTADVNNQTLTVGEYALATNITLEGGTWDGGEITSAGTSRNLINIGHASNVTIKNATFKNCLGAHLIELCGVKDATVTGCKFGGFIYGDNLNESEAIQLDVCHTAEDGTEWNSAYLSDDTYCQNVTINKNTFTDYPRAVGNHHRVSGKHNRNITITNNTFKNTTALRNYALNLVGFNDTVVENNTITGFKWGVRAKNCKNLSLKNNTIKNSSEIGISCTDATFDDITGNKITSVDRHGICINGTSSVTNLSSNTISKTKGCGIYLGDATKVENLNNNKISDLNTKIYADGISLYGSKTYAKNIRGNVIKNCSQYGILLSKAKADVITQNQISNTKSAGISIAKGSTNTITKNKISNSNSSGISIASGSASKITQNKISKSNYIGISINSSKKTTVTNNTLSSIKSAAIYLTGNTKATIKNNTIKNTNYYHYINSQNGQIKESSLRGYVNKSKKKYIVKIYTKNNKKLTAVIGKKSYKAKKAKKKQLTASEKKLDTGEKIYIVQIPQSKKKKTLTITLTDKKGNTITRKFKVKNVSYMS